MKKFLLVILIISCVCIVDSNIAFTEVKFGNWDKWDEMLPPAENESWHVNSSQPAMNQPVQKGTWTNSYFGDSGDDVVFLFSDFYFYGTKNGETKASVLFYALWEGDADKEASELFHSSKNDRDLDKEDWVIQDASLILIAFPPEKKKMIIRAYVKEDQVFKFFEEWEIVFKNHTIVVPKKVKFYKFFEDWLKKVCSRKIIPEGMINFMLPELMVYNKNDFAIAEGPIQ